MKTNCKVCNAEFEAVPCNIKSGRAKYCSKACRYEGQRKQETRPCSYCGTPITRTPSKFVAEIVYCDSACRNKHVASKDRPADRIEGDIVFIPLSQGQWAKVDRSDYESIPMLREEMWTAMWSETSQTFYAMRRVDGETFLMHRVITGAPDGMDVNHRGHDGTDNTRENIEVCTRSQNIQYKRKPRMMGGKPTSSQYKGVSFDKRYGMWAAKVDSSFVGYFHVEAEAAEAYNREALARFGHYAKLNEIEQIN